MRLSGIARALLDGVRQLNASGRSIYQATVSHTHLAVRRAAVDRSGNCRGNTATGKSLSCCPALSVMPYVKHERMRKRFRGQVRPRTRRPAAA